MTLEDIRAALDTVRAHAERGGDEAAHVEADALHQAVLQAIADGTCEDPRAAARAALETEDMHFSRWYT